MSTIEIILCILIFLELTLIVVMVAAWFICMMVQAGELSWIKDLLNLFGTAAPVTSPAAASGTSQSAPEQQGPTPARYRTQDGEADYGFTLARLGDDYRVYVVEFPCERAKRAPHLLQDRKGPYICWSQPIQTKKEALAVAGLWADSVQRYLKTGQTF